MTSGTLMKKALLALEDGRVFEGTAFGAEASHTGEICFNTSMTGYQEVLTDPSYRGQIVAMTYTMIGNYGVNPLDFESNAPHVRGFVIEELCDTPSNWRSTQSLGDWLKEWNIPGIQGIDTRALTTHLRTRGAMRAVITSEDMTPEEAVKIAANSPSMAGSDFVREVSTPANYSWDTDNSLSRDWVLPNGQGHPDPVLVPAKYKIVAFDFGIKFNILRRLRQEGFSVEVVNARTSAADILALNPDGVFLSNGPGDPAALDYVHHEVRQLLGRKPIFAICLGHQILGHAFGGKTFKLPFGHRGGNQPVKDLRSGTVAITSQNHGFAVDQESLPPNLRATHVSLFDGTLQGLARTDRPAFCFQGHPEASPGPHDISYLFERFVALMDPQSRREHA
jgi:carbamoyl-phosphate synthase small subunit